MLKSLLLGIEIVWFGHVSTETTGHGHIDGGTDLITPGGGTGTIGHISTETGV